MRPNETWTVAQRQRQAEICRQIQPSLYSTGPQTAQGKRRARMNAYRHGQYSPPLASRETSRKNAAYVIRKALLDTMSEHLDPLTRLQFEADVQAFEAERERTEQVDQQQHAGGRRCRDGHQKQGSAKLS